MSRHKDESLEKVTLRLFTGDIARIKEYYPNLGHNRAIREIISKHLRSLDEKTSQRRAQND